MQQECVVYLPSVFPKNNFNKPETNLELFVSETNRKQWKSSF